MKNSLIIKPSDLTSLERAKIRAILDDRTYSTWEWSNLRFHLTHHHSSDSTLLIVQGTIVEEIECHCSHCSGSELRFTRLQTSIEVTDTLEPVGYQREVMIVANETRPFR